MLTVLERTHAPCSQASDRSRIGESNEWWHGAHETTLSPSAACLNNAAIAMTTSAGNSFNDLFGEDSIKNKQKYADRHGYIYLCSIMISQSRVTNIWAA